jgi:pilus assembly protein CpaE
VTSASGGSGASTIAVNLAVTMANLAGECGLFDLDLEKGDLAYLLNVTPQHTIAELCRNSAGLDRNMLEKSLAAHESGVNLLAASPESAGESFVDIRQLSRILELASAMFPCCVVDFGRQAGGMRHLDLLRKCHRILIVLKLDFTGVCNARRVLDALERERIDTSKAMLVVNRRGMPVEIPPNKAKTILGRDVDHCIPDDEMTSNFCVNCGTPYTLEAPKKSVSKALRILANMLVDDTAAGGTTPTSTEPERSEIGSRRTLQLVQQAAGLLLCMRTTT